MRATEPPRWSRLVFFLNQTGSQAKRLRQQQSLDEAFKTSLQDWPDN
jgi:hypothetical protein